MLKFIKKCWLGEVSLKKAFWLVYVFNGLLLFFLIDILIDIFVTGQLTPFYVHDKYLDLIITLMFPYSFISAMCVWVCGKNSKLIWRILSRFIVILQLIFFSFHMI